MYVETARCDLKLPGCLFPSPPSSPLISFPPPPDFLLPSRRLTFWNVLNVPARFTSKLRVFLHRITKKIVPSAAGGWGGGGGREGVNLGSLAGAGMNPKWQRLQRSNVLPHFNQAKSRRRRRREVLEIPNSPTVSPNLD